MLACSCYHFTTEINITLKMCLKESSMFLSPSFSPYPLGDEMERELSERLRAPCCQLGLNHKIHYNQARQKKNRLLNGTGSQSPKNLFLLQRSTDNY